MKILQILELQQYLWKGRYSYEKNETTHFADALCVHFVWHDSMCGQRDNDRNDASDKSDKKGDGILDDAVNDVTQGVDDVTDDVTDGIDDVTDDVTDGVDNAADDLTDENGAKKEGDRMKNTDQGDATGNADDSMR